MNEVAFAIHIRVWLYEKHLGSANQDIFLRAVVRYLEFGVLMGLEIPHMAFSIQSSGIR
jgi:hypothetical protein